MEFWTTREGDEIKLEDLSDSHLHNIIKMLETKNYTDTYMYPAMQLERLVRQHEKTYPFIREMAELLMKYSEGRFQGDNQSAYEELLNEMNPIGQEF